MIWKLHYNIGRINSNPNSRSHSKNHHSLSTLVLAPCLPQSQHKALSRSRRLVLRRHRHRCTCPQARRHVSHHYIINETKAKLFDYFLRHAHTHTNKHTHHNMRVVSRALVVHRCMRSNSHSVALSEVRQPLAQSANGWNTSTRSTDLKCFLVYYTLDCMLCYYRSRAEFSICLCHEVRVNFFTDRSYLLARGRARRLHVKSIYVRYTVRMWSKYECMYTLPLFCALCSSRNASLAGHNGFVMYWSRITCFVYAYIFPTETDNSDIETQTHVSSIIRNILATLYRLIQRTMVDGVALAVAVTATSRVALAFQIPHNPINRFVARHRQDAET